MTATRFIFVPASGDGKVSGYPSLVERYPGSLSLFEDLCRKKAIVPGNAVAIAGSDRILMFMVIRERDSSDPEAAFVASARVQAMEWLDTRGFTGYEDALNKIK